MVLHPTASGELIINGIGSAAGGRYVRVDVNGVGTLIGDVSAESVKTNGTLKARGSIMAGRLDGEGTMRLQGSLQANEAKINGMVRVQESVSGQRLEMYGMLTVAQNCEVDDCVVKGALTVGGLLNIGLLELDMLARCTVREIGGETIRVRKSSGKWDPLWRWLVPAYSTELHAKVIEGDEIELVYTKADVVRGKLVTIGKGCSIGRVEYSGELKKLPGAHIGKEVFTNGN
ncbi:hypothetical protein [Paenibacillus koleovorans]|uniref:hypothetical protein n=1 Tax=Paenibacillus koleovorans TaxID=121608 RepID=UPI000FDC8D91|nr:hypothetical protein [Paenibacillus koleovorans]